MADITDITIHVDPACPWAWLTSRWLAEVEKVRPVPATTRLFVLGEINHDREPSERALRAHSAGLVAMHLLVAARRAGGESPWPASSPRSGRPTTSAITPSTSRRC